MDRQVEIVVPMAWLYLQTIVQAVEGILQDYPVNLRQAASMVSSELVENAIKHGHTVPDFPNLKFGIFLENEKIRIEVKNGFVGKEKLRCVQKHIRQITESDNKEELYANQMSRLMSARKRTSGQLGLYRIGYEGKFELSSNYEGQTITVSALRAIK